MSIYKYKKGNNPLSPQCRYLTSQFCNCMQKFVTSVRRRWEVGLKNPELYYSNCMMIFYGFKRGEEHCLQICVWETKEKYWSAYKSFKMCGGGEEMCGGRDRVRNYCCLGIYSIVQKRHKETPELVDGDFPLGQMPKTKNLHLTHSGFTC